MLHIQLFGSFQINDDEKPFVVQGSVAHEQAVSLGAACASRIARDGTECHRKCALDCDCVPGALDLTNASYAWLNIATLSDVNSRKKSVLRAGVKSRVTMKQPSQ
jgi:hypothetical protein